MYRSPIYQLSPGRAQRRRRRSGSLRPAGPTRLRRNRPRRARLVLAVTAVVLVALWWSAPSAGWLSNPGLAVLAGPPPPRLVPPTEVAADSGDPTPRRTRRASVRAAARGTGRLHVAPGTSRPSGSGPVQTYAVEIEGGLGVSPRRFAASVERTLADPRGWTTAGTRAFSRTGGASAAIRVTLASPRTTDALCAPLTTRSEYSCFQRGRAVLNAERWAAGASTYRGRLAAYRRYMINHEVGHALGFGHPGCPRRGARAPVMLQQTKGLGGCRRSPWPSRAEDPGGR